MIAFGEIRSFQQDPDEILQRKHLLRQTVVCIGWLKLLSVTCYAALYLLVWANSQGTMAEAIQIMILAIIPAQVLHGVLLFLGALEEKKLALEISLWLCLILASYNTVLGFIGGIYFIRTGHLTLHFILAIIFAFLACSLFAVLCHDILIIYAYKISLLPPNTLEDHTISESVIVVEKKI